MPVNNVHKANDSNVVVSNVVVESAVVVVDIVVVSITDNKTETDHIVNMIEIIEIIMIIEIEGMIKEIIEEMIVNRIELIIENSELIKINIHKKIILEEVKEEQEDHIIIIQEMIGIIKEIIRIEHSIEEDMKPNKIEVNKEVKEDHQKKDIIGMMMNNDHI